MSTPTPSSFATAPTPFPFPPQMKRILRFLAVLASFVSLPALACGVWLLVTRGYDCEDLLVPSAMRVGVGVGLLGVFAVSNAAGYATARKGAALAGYAVLAVALVVALTVGLVLVGVYKMEARRVPASPGWFQTRLAITGNWNEVKSCLYNDGICSDFAYRTGGLSAHDFGKIKLSPVEVYITTLYKYIYPCMHAWNVRTVGG